MSVTIFYLIGGILFLYLGAEGLVRGSTSLAFRLGLTRLVIGLTIVAFGTSSPEMVVSIKATLDQNGAISLGNVIGSNICNIALILGLSALVCPVRIDVQVVRIQIPIMIAVSLILMLLLKDGRLERMEGLGLFAGIIVYTSVSIYMARKEQNRSAKKTVVDAARIQTRSAWFDGLLILTGLVMLIVGARLFVSGSVSLARMFGISQAVIGLTIVAVGTSLPELATSLVAAIRKEGDIAVGNIVGSNIFNILAILGLASLIQPLAMDGIKVVDLVVMIVTAVLILPMAKSGFLLSRLEGAALLISYLGYLYYLMH